jgi:hypothetical protein
MNRQEILSYVLQSKEFPICVKVDDDLDVEHKLLSKMLLRRNRYDIGMSLERDKNLVWFRRRENGKN